MRQAAECHKRDCRARQLAALSGNSLAGNLGKHSAALHENRSRQSKCRTRAGIEIRLNPKALPVIGASEKANRTSRQRRGWGARWRLNSFFARFRFIWLGCAAAQIGLLRFW